MASGFVCRWCARLAGQRRTFTRLTVGKLKSPRFHEPSLACLCQPCAGQHAAYALAIRMNPARSSLCRPNSHRYPVRAKSRPKVGVIRHEQAVVQCVENSSLTLGTFLSSSGNYFLSILKFDRGTLRVILSSPFTQSGGGRLSRAGVTRARTSVLTIARPCSIAISSSLSVLTLLTPFDGFYSFLAAPSDVPTAIVIRGG